MTFSYEQGFVKAVFTFRHQTIFDIPSQTTKPLLPFPSNFRSESVDYLGPLLSPKLAADVASGKIHPETHQPLLQSSLEHSAEFQTEKFKQSMAMESIQEMEVESENSMNAFGAQSFQTENNNSDIHFSSPFISVSFKALIEKPSSRGIDQSNDVSILDQNYTTSFSHQNETQCRVNSVSEGCVDSSVSDNPFLFSISPNMKNRSSRKRNFDSLGYCGINKKYAVVAESPPREKPKIQCVFESPCSKRVSSTFAEELQYNIDRFP
jgi:hypothetical protein